MFDPQKPLERISGESESAHAALIEYWKMGADRSLEKLCKCLKASHLSENNGTGKKPPSFNTLKTWSSKFNWMLRINAADRLKVAGVVQEVQTDYLESVNRLRIQTQKMGEDIFAESRAQLKLVSEYREKVVAENRVNGSELKSLTNSLNTIAQVADTATGMVARAIGIDKVMEALLQKTE